MFGKDKKIKNEKEMSRIREDEGRSREDTLRKHKEKNSEIAMVLYVFVGLFVLCIGYLSYFLAVDANTVINNSYNKRSSLLAKSIFRGDILSADGEKLAYSIDNGDGTETRVYPYKNMFTHVVGRFDNTKTGIESSQDFTLLTSSTNLLETVVKQLKNEKQIGNNVITTLDVDIQKAAYEALGSHKGAVVVMEPSTGRILAMVSKPDYDPNTVLQNWDSLVEDSNNQSALLNRATQGLYPPGSTFKIVTLLSYMRQNKNYEDYTYDCTGSLEVTDHTIHCYKNKVHGKEDLKESFANSCNTSFASLGMSLNLKEYASLCNSLLFNSKLNIPLSYKQSSFSLSSDASESEISQTVIGQGKTLVTPMHMAMIVSAIANGGNLMTPYLVERIENHHGTVIKENSKKLDQSLMSSSEAAVLTEYMEEVVNSGTATSLKNSSYQVAGKTGTAEVSSNSNHNPHAWFVGFAPADNADIVVSVIVENSGAASEYAVPVANKIFKAYFNKYGK